MIMANILIIDDAPFWRELVSGAVEQWGHRARTANNGREGLVELGRGRVDLIVLDTEMPQMSGLVFLEQARAQERWAHVPVIFLTGDMHKEDIIRAKRLGAEAYLLKASFSLEELKARITHSLTNQHRPAEGKDASNAVSAPPPQSSNVMLNHAHEDPHFPRLLNRQDCIRRAQRSLHARTLSGVAAEVIAMAASPNTELSQLAALIGRDPVLSARVMRAANNPAHITSRGPVSTVADAVKNVGCTTIRDIAASMAVFDAMPASEPDGFNPIRCWQHSFAVATLCGRMAPEADRGRAYLVGLCHDLGEILFYSCFSPEYTKVIAAQKATGRSRGEAERAMLGMTQGELVQTIVEQIGLPAAIMRPIVAFHEAGPARVASEPTARLLQVADFYATALGLTASEHALLRPLTRAECRAATGSDDPTPPDISNLPAEVLGLTAMLARLSPREEEKIIQPLLPRTSARVWLAREKIYSPFDPLAAALESLADVTVTDSVPEPGELEGYDGLMMAARNPTVTGFGLSEIQRAVQRESGVVLPSLWLTARVVETTGAHHAGDQPVPEVWPVTLKRLADFLESLAREPVGQEN
ncbi:MAG: HDOD domain-containing protein [Tepidisphaeraceae bacterium]